jgi:hypothetical protein
MEGYFPIQEYCKLAEISTDTAYHRAIRKRVDSFTDKYGRMFIYFTDEKIAPDGFVSLHDYAKLKGVEYEAVRMMHRKKRFNEEDVYIVPHHVFRPKTYDRIFINKNAEIPKPPKVMNCPEGYIHISEWAKKNEVSPERLNQMILHNRIETIKVGKFRYIKEDAKLPIDRRIYGNHKNIK